MSTGSSSRKTGRTRNEEKVSLFKYLRSSLHCGLGFSIPFSLIMYLFTVYVIGIPVLLYDTVILQIYFLIISVIMFLFAATILWLPGVGIDRLISKAGRVFGLVPLFTVILSVPVVFLILLSGWVLIDRPFDFSSPWFIPVCIAFCVVGVGVGFMLKDTALGIKRAVPGGRSRAFDRQLFPLYTPVDYCCRAHTRWVRSQKPWLTSGNCPDGIT